MESVSNLWKILFEYNTIDYQVDMSVSQMSDTTGIERRVILYRIAEYIRWGLYL